jgi:multiple sugar transport system substrate-binding protein
MKFFQEQTSKGYFRVAGEDKYLSGPFSNQKMLTYQGSSAGFAHINTNGAFEIAVVEAPVFEGKDNAVIQQGASLFATNTVSPQEQYASYEFIKFLTNTENTAKFATSTGYLPVRKSAQDLDMVKALVEDETNLYGQIYKVAQEALEYAYYTPAVNNGSSARTSVEEKYSAFVTNGTANIEDFVKELLTEVETSISRQ